MRRRTLTYVVAVAIAAASAQGVAAQTDAVFNISSTSPASACATVANNQCVTLGAIFSAVTGNLSCQLDVLDDANLTVYNPQSVWYQLEIDGVIVDSGEQSGIAVSGGELLTWTTNRIDRDFFVCAGNVTPPAMCQTRYELGARGVAGCNQPDCVVGIIEFVSGQVAVTAHCSESINVGNPCNSWRDAWPAIIPAGTTFCVDGIDLDEDAAVNDTRTGPGTFRNTAFCCCAGHMCNQDYAMLLNEASVANRNFHCSEIPISSEVLTCLPTLQPSAVPTAAPTTCGDTITRLTPGADGVLTVLADAAACDVSQFPALSSHRFPPSTTTLKILSAGSLLPPINPDAFAPFAADLPELSLDLSQNSYTRIGTSAFAAFAPLVLRLDLSKGAISAVAIGAFQSLTRLEALDLSHNRIIGEIGWLGNVPTLEELQLHNNNVTAVLNSSLLQTPNLQILRLDNNAIVHMDSDPFASTPQLRVANISLYNNVILCAATPRAGAGPRLQCGGCLPNAHYINATVFHTAGAFIFCAPPGRVVVASHSQYRPNPNLSWDDVPQGDANANSEPDSGGACSATTYSRHSKTQWALNYPYRIAPVMLVDPAVTVPTSSGQGTTTTVVARFSLEPQPQDLFVNANTGEILGQLTQVGITQSILKVTHEGAESLTIATIMFNVSRADVDVPQFGPNNRDCARPDMRVDTIPFDRRFTCNCSKVPEDRPIQTTGENCDPLVTTASGSDDNDNDVTSATTIGVLAAFVLLMIIAGLLIYRNRRLEAWKANQPANFDEIVANLHTGGIKCVRSSSDEVDANALVDVPAEIARRDLVLLEQIGNGNFGDVHKALYNTHTTASGRAVDIALPVAVKTLKEFEHSGAKAEFLREAAVTWQFQHKNVVQMHGVVTCGLPYMLVLELCSVGELKQYLVDTPRHDILQMYSFAMDIAEGMEHLAAAGFVHRDLACRNVLLNEALDAKIADFGMGRDLQESDYYSATEAGNLLLPLRWSDPHVLETRKFSELTDVWSFGITVIEVFTAGQTPYDGWSNGMVLERVKAGHRIARPTLCPSCLYNDAILPCWLPLNPKPGEPGRPTFSQLVKILAAMKDEVTVAAQGAMWDSMEEMWDGYGDAKAERDDDDTADDDDQNAVVHACSSDNAVYLHQNSSPCDDPRPTYDVVHGATLPTPAADKPAGAARDGDAMAAEAATATTTATTTTMAPSNLYTTFDALKVSAESEKSRPVSPAVATDNSRPRADEPVYVPPEAQHKEELYAQIPSKGDSLVIEDVDMTGTFGASQQSSKESSRSGSGTSTPQATTAASLQLSKATVAALQLPPYVSLPPVSRPTPRCNSAGPSRKSEYVSMKPVATRRLSKSSGNLIESLAEPVVPSAISLTNSPSNTIKSNHSSGDLILPDGADQLGPLAAGLRAWHTDEPPAEQDAEVTV